jgi:hypothetical protein
LMRTNNQEQIGFTTDNSAVVRYGAFAPWP